MAKTVLSRVFLVGFTVGKVTVFAVGLAMMLAVVFGVTTTALAAVPGDPFKLGQTNAINRLSQLVGSVAGPMLRIDNNGTGPALDLRVGSATDPAQNTVAPMKVNSEQQVDNLNADQIDGKDSSQIGVNGAEQVSATTSEMDSLSPKTVNATCPDGKIPVGGGARLQGLTTDVALNESHRNFADSRQWQTSAHEVNPTTEVWRLETYAICVLAGGP